MATLIELLQAHERGEVVQCVPSLGDPVTCKNGDEVARAWLDAGVGVRIKPQLTPVDLSVLIDSGIDCEFTDHKGGKYLSRLAEIKGGYYWADQELYGMGGEAECRPRLDHWHSWQGGECPLPRGLRVELRHRAGIQGMGSFIGSVDEDIRWAHVLGSGLGAAADIIAFRIPTDKPLADGYCWPWEVTQ